MSAAKGREHRPVRDGMFIERTFVHVPSSAMSGLANVSRRLRRLEEKLFAVYCTVPKKLEGEG